MSDEVLEGLLEGVGRGDEELIDPREGSHEATVTDVRLVENGPTAKVRHALVITWGGMEDAEGRDFELDDRVNIPQSDSDDVVKRMFQQTLHTFGFVPYDDRRPYFADDAEQRAKFLEAFQTLKGSTTPIDIAIKGGWPRVRVRRSK